MSKTATLEQLGKVEAELALLREMIDHKPAEPELGAETRGGDDDKKKPPPIPPSG